MTILRWALLLCFAFSTSPLAANTSSHVRELSISANIRKSQLNKDNFQKTTAFTGSYAVYLWKRSAIEVSYTQGTSVLQSLPSPLDTQIRIESDFQLVGLDFLITFSDRNNPLHPYLKLGVAYMKKEIVRITSGLGASPLQEVEGIVPSAGVGLKLKTTENFYIKFGADIWTSPIGENQDSLDYTFRLGVSMYF